MIKVLILDDHQLILQAISSFLEKEKDIEVLGQASNKEQAIEILKTNKIDILLSDINLSSKEDGIEIYKMLHKRHPDLKVIFLTMHNQISIIKEAFDSGASGYILKNYGIEETLSAIRSVYEGKDYFGDTVAKTYMEGVKAFSEKKENSLTKRQLQVLSLLGTGMKSSDIATELKISIYTVEAHKRMMIDKLNLKGASNLLKYAIENTKR